MSPPATQESSQPQAHPHKPSRHHIAASTLSAPALSKPRRHSLQFSFPPLFQPNTSSTSLVPSTAEGKPIPVDNSTAEHRTSALRELSSNFPTRHRYTQSTGAQSSTYSQPVIVRSYYAPVPAQPADRGVIVVNRRGHRPALNENSGPSALVRRVLPFGSGVTPSRNGMLGTMARNRTKKRLENEPEEAKLPSVDAFRFKSFMANLEDQNGVTDINADLDRIAEICAKSRYSLSNQYEVHYAPHGSGAAFVAGAIESQEVQGPTLQVVSSDDETNLKQSRKRPMGVRRNSRAMGTLETIMSSSRSSEEDKSKKKSAAEIADEVRGRTTQKGSSRHGSLSPSEDGAIESVVPEVEITQRTPRQRRSGSLALIDGTRLSMNLNDLDTNRTSAVGLVSEPALPQTSSSQLEIRTAPETKTKEQIPAVPKKRPAVTEGIDRPVAHGAMSSIDAPNTKNNFMSTLSGWMSWRSPNASPMPQGRAEGSLRELLKNRDIKGKGVEAAAYQ
ncbi:hypothetical protein FPOAC2_10816 [Fusarium poae]|uniref:Uncharacterized protein n=1 Tax=Fusarium poae TaxID=36050 RepID=A0A1B8AC37_FUSPO|nr:hypothetical protein FPOAC1_010535 [Fusarium poae]KAG8665734.1 hypothetical protein FPOAC1_010535 [Fusarium poae]OBS18029.1 hypothetical protein FPOA_09757 [Fusarium poae]